MTKHYSVTETAKLIRAALKEAFPETKFSVRSSSYSMGASIDVSWTDGPISAQVDLIVKGFAGASFDGMQDLKSHHSSMLNGEKVSFGADYVHTSREVSKAKVAAIAALLEAKGRDHWLTICVQAGHPFPTRAVQRHDNAQDVALVARFDLDDDDACTLRHRTRGFTKPN